MQKKHFIATDTFISNETKKEFFEMAKGMSSKDFFTPSKNEQVKCIQHWMGTGDFFFCHWKAIDEQAIIDRLSVAGLEQFIVTMATPVDFPKMNLDFLQPMINKLK